ncbi:MAG: sigma-70 family RNA polymerase sigma factor [Chloroflexota bacterium]
MKYAHLTDDVLGVMCREDFTAYERDSKHYRIDSDLRMELFFRALVVSSRPAFDEMMLECRRLFYRWILTDQNRDMFNHLCIVCGYTNQIGLNSRETMFLHVIMTFCINLMRTFRNQFHDHPLTPRTAFFEKFAGLDKLYAYLKLVVHTTLLQMIKDESNSPSTEDEFIADPANIENQYDQTERAVSLRECIQSAFSTLSKKQQLLLECRFFKNMKPQAIAEQHPEFWKTAHDVSSALNYILKKLSSFPCFQDLGIQPFD